MGRDQMSISQERQPAAATSGTAADREAPARISAVVARLRSAYGAPPPREPVDPLDGLIATILSPNTSDENSSRAYASLKARFPRCEDVVEAPPEEVRRAISMGSLAATKAPRIQSILRHLRMWRQTVSLDFLHGLTDEAAADWLGRLPGVGPKTAACVLLFCLGRDVFPVDTHVERIAKRLHIASSQASAADVQKALEAATAPRDRYDAHVLMLRLGRTVCRPSLPRCPECPIQDLCPSSARGQAGA